MKLERKNEKLSERFWLIQYNSYVRDQSLLAEFELQEEYGLDKKIS